MHEPSDGIISISIAGILAIILIVATTMTLGGWLAGAEISTGWKVLIIIAWSGFIPPALLTAVVVWLASRTD